MIEYDEHNLLDLSKGSFVIEFYARWCGTCRQVTKSFLAIEEDYPSLTFIRVDTEKEKVFTKKSKVKGIPYIVYLKDGKEVSRIGGSLTIQEMKTYLEAVL